MVMRLEMLRDDVDAGYMQLRETRRTKKHCKRWCNASSRDKPSNHPSSRYAFVYCRLYTPFI